MHLSFAGCGFLGIYHVGVASCFREYAPHLLVSKIGGASVGSIAAVGLLCGVPLGQVTTAILKVAVKARSRTLGPLHPSFDLNQLIREGLEKTLPENAHELCNGRLYISCTSIPACKNMLISEFNSREELIQALCCSCFIPFYSGIIVPTYRGMRLVDGGLSNNLPVLDENTITVSPFAGEHDICPEDESCNILQINVVNTSVSISPENLCRLTRILFPPHPEILNKMCQQGFDDAVKYLQRHNLISCTRCLAVQSVLSVSETSATDTDGTSEEDSETEHAYDDCLECRYRRKQALIDNLPDAVVKAIEEACDQVNKGVINWLFRHRPMKLLSILSLPYVLPFDITIIIFCKIWKMLPDLQKELQTKFHSIIALIKTLLNKIDNSRHLYSAKFSCQLAITEFDYTEESISSSFSVPKPETPTHDTCKYISENNSIAKDKLLLSKPEIPATVSPSVSTARQQRKSYAGFTKRDSESVKVLERRKSLCDIQQPSRVIRNMKIGFSVDINDENDKKRNMIDAFKAFSERDRELSVIEMTNEALKLEKKCIGHYQGSIKPENADTLEKLLNVTSNEAVMSYFYMDDDKTVKVTELYNVDDADTSAVLSDEEREVNNKLQWESDWLTEPNISYSVPAVSIADSFDDKEFDMSDTELEVSEMHDDFKETPITNEDSKVNNLSTKPRRKMSFAVFNESSERLFST